MTDIPAHLDRRGDRRLTDAEIARLVDVATGRKRDWAPMRGYARPEEAAPAPVVDAEQPTAADRAAVAFSPPPAAAAERPPWSPPVANRKPASTVWVDGKEFHSVKVAFEKLKLPMPKRYKFRAELKKVGRLAFTFEGKVYGFETEAERTKK